MTLYLNGRSVNRLKVKYRFNRSEKACEICGNTNKKVFHKHHIIPRTSVLCTNMASNLAHICSNCHMAVHAGQYIIEGVYFTSGGHRLFWHRAGEEYVIRPGIFLRPDGEVDIIDT